MVAGATVSLVLWLLSGDPGYTLWVTPMCVWHTVSPCLVVCFVCHSTLAPSGAPLFYSCSVGINLLMALDANHTLDHFEIAQGNYYEKAELEQIEMALARNRAQKQTESTVSAVAALSGMRACAAASVMCVGRKKRWCRLLYSDRWLLPDATTHTCDWVLLWCVGGAMLNDGEAGNGRRGSIGGSPDSRSNSLTYTGSMMSNTVSQA